MILYILIVSFRENQVISVSFYIFCMQNASNTCFLLPVFLLIDVILVPSFFKTFKMTVQKYQTDRMIDRPAIENKVVILPWLETHPPASL